MDAERRPRLRMRGVTKSFGATRALVGVDLDVASGSIHALIGENGAGKSTLMKVLSGAHAPDEGSIWLDGEPYAPSSPAEGRSAGVAMIYQELSLAPHLTVMENILLGIEPTRGPILDRRAMRRRAHEALEKIDHTDLALDARVLTLSTAQRQLVEIARSQALGSRVLVLDEPTSSLTRADIERLFRLLRRLREEGQAIIYISHALEEIEELTDTYTVLRDGASVGSGKTDDTSVEEIVALMVGRRVEELYPRSQRKRGGELLTVRSASGTPLPREASLTVHRGEVVGIAGLVGAGRSEFLRMLFGLEPLVSGEVCIGTFQGRATPGRRWSQGVGLVSEDRKTEGLALGLSIAENVTLARLQGLGPRGFVWPSRQGNATRPWIDALPIRCLSPTQRVDALSGGNQQKVALARLLHADCDLFLLDEPTRGIDVGSKAQIYALIDRLARAGKAILMVSSYLPELLGTCDRIAVMSRGRLGEALPVSERTEHSIMLEATGAL